MIITDLRIKNFRNVEQQTYTFGRINHITGHNGAGKSTIAEVIVWAFFGTDLSGTSKQEERLTRLGTTDEMRVGVTLMVSGKTVTLERVKPIDGAMTLSVNRKKAGQAAAEVWVGTKDTFLSGFLPGYFGSLEPKDARSVLASLLQPQTVEEVLAKLDEEQRLALADADLLDVELLLDRQRKILKAAEQDLSYTEGRHMEAVHLAEQPERAFDEERFQEIQTAYKDACSVQSPAIPSLDALLKKREDLLGRHRRLKQSLKPAPDENAACRLCQQPLPAEKRQAYAEHIRLENVSIQQEIDEVITEGKAVAEEIRKLEFARSTITEQAEIVLNREQLEREYEALIRERAQVQAYNDGIVQSRKRHQELLSEVHGKRVIVHQLKSIVSAAIAYRVKFSEMQIRPLMRGLKDTIIQLFEVNGEGEFRPVFRLTWRGLPYRSLSTAEKIMCDLELHNLFASVLEEAIPAFVDNAEALVRLPIEDIKGQVFTARVADAPLSVEVLIEEVGATA